MEYDIAIIGCGALVRPDHYGFGGFASNHEARHLLGQFAPAAPSAAAPLPHR